MSAGHWLIVYAVIGFLYVCGYIPSTDAGFPRAVFVFCAWPIDLVRVLCRGGRDWWRS